jgi:hypothetical protein
VCQLQPLMPQCSDPVVRPPDIRRVTFLRNHKSPARLTLEPQIDLSSRPEGSKHDPRARLGIGERVMVGYRQS